MGRTPSLTLHPRIYRTIATSVAAHRSKDRAADGAVPQNIGPIHAARSSPVPHVLPESPYLACQGEDAASPGTGLNRHL